MSQIKPISDVSVCTLTLFSVGSVKGGFTCVPVLHYFNQVIKRLYFEANQVIKRLYIEAFCQTTNSVMAWTDIVTLQKIDS